MLISLLFPLLITTDGCGPGTVSVVHHEIDPISKTIKMSAKFRSWSINQPIVRATLNLDWSPIYNTSVGFQLLEGYIKNEVSNPMPVRTT